MTIDEFLAKIATWGAAADGFMEPQIIVTVLTAIFLALAVAFFAASLKVSNSAFRARDEADAMLRNVQSYAVEVRQLAAQTERFSARLAAGDAATAKTSSTAEAANAKLSDRIRAVRVGSHPQTPEANVEFLDDEEPAATVEADGADAEKREPNEASAGDAPEPKDAAANARLADATRAASEPRSLLSGMLRRR